MDSYKRIKLASKVEFVLTVLPLHKLYSLPETLVLCLSYVYHGLSIVDALVYTFWNSQSEIKTSDPGSLENVEQLKSVWGILTQIPLGVGLKMGGYSCLA